MTDPSNPAASTPAPSAPTAIESPPPDIEIDGLTPDQAASMIGWAKEDLAKGKITQDQANKMFEELGATPEQRASDTRSEEVKALDHQFPPAKESDFTIRYFKPGQAAEETPELKQFDQSARGWLAGAQFDRTLGNSLITAVERVTERTATMTAAQLEQYGQTEYAKLESVFGTELEAKLKAAGLMVSELEKTRPGLRAFLKTAGVGDSAIVASMLIQQAERYWARKKG